MVRSVAVAVFALALANPAAGQRVAVGVGPVWQSDGRFLENGRQLAFSAMQLDVTLSERHGSLGWLAGASFMTDMRGVYQVICDPPGPCYSPSYSTMSSWYAGVVAWPFGQILELSGGPAVFVSPGVTNRGEHAITIAARVGAVVYPLGGRTIGVGLDLSRLATPQRFINWMLSPRLQIGLTFLD